MKKVLGLFILIISFFSFQSQVLSQDNTFYPGINCVETSFPSGSSFYSHAGEIVNSTGFSTSYVCSVPLDQTSGYSTENRVRVFSETLSAAHRLICTVYIRDIISGSVYSGTSVTGPASIIQNFYVYFPSIPSVTTPLAVLFCSVPNGAQINGYLVDY